MLCTSIVENEGAFLSSVVATSCEELKSYEAAACSGAKQVSCKHLENYVRFYSYK